LEDVDVDEKIILKWISKRHKVEGCQLQSFNSGYRPRTKNSTEPSSSIKGTEFFTG
jgi:hypothetical protein